MPRRTKAPEVAVEPLPVESNGHQPSVAELPQTVAFDPAEQVILDGYGERYRAREKQVQDLLQQSQQDLNQYSSMLVGAVQFALRTRQLNPDDYDIDVAPGAGAVTVRLKMVAAPPA